LPLSGHSAAFPPPGPGGAYPPFAPGGRVDPALMRQSEPGQSRGGAATTAVGLGATIIAIVTKLGLAIKFALPLLSALASFWVYAALYGWQFGLGIVALLFVHEMGHVVLLRAKGLPMSAPVFIPLLGAFVAMKRMPVNVRDQAEIAIAGPLAGALGGFACYALYLQSGLHVWLALAFLSYLLNLLNLIPLGPLDGGRIAGAVPRWMWPVGLALMLVAIYYTHSILLILMAWLGFMRMISAFRKSPARAAYYQVPDGDRLAIALLYFGLVVVLAMATYFTQSMLPPGGAIFGQ
jgi:Zn-dependent protease